MSDAASGGSKPTNKTHNKKVVTNEGHNNNRNGCRTYRSGVRYNTENFKGKLEGLSILGLKEDKHTDSFMVF